MKDQNVITDIEPSNVKWNRALDLFIESVMKPDHALRDCAHNQKCYNELIEIRKQVLEDLKGKRWN